MHIFFLDQKRLDCAAMIPKGDYVTVCLLGDDIDRDLVEEFFATPRSKPGSLLDGTHKQALAIAARDQHRRPCHTWTV
jgi:hypothetical protein